MNSKQRRRFMRREKPKPMVELATAVLLKEIPPLDVPVLKAVTTPRGVRQAQERLHECRTWPGAIGVNLTGPVGNKPVFVVTDDIEP